MRLALIGQSAFGKAVLERLASGNRHEVVGVFAAPDGARGQEPLAAAAVDLGVPVWQPQRLRDAESIATVQSLGADLCVMAYVTDIVPLDIINAPTYGTIQYHPSLLPKHRGPSAINWAIINGESRTGLTIFWPGEGLDTGPILMQREVDIGQDDTVGSLYFDKLFPMGVDALVESVDLVHRGQGPRIQQDESLATYESWCGRAESQIDWNRPAAELHNLIRGCDPQPGAWTTWHGERLSLYGSAVCADERQEATAPGTVLSVDVNGMVVSAGDSAVRVQRVRAGRGAKVAAAESAVQAGDVLGD